MPKDPERKKDTSIEPYEHRSHAVAFDVETLGQLGAELEHKMRNDVVFFPNKRFRAAIPELMELIPQEVQSTLNEIEELKYSNLQLSLLIETDYLKELQVYLNNLDMSFRLSVLVSTIFVYALVTASSELGPHILGPDLAKSFMSTLAIVALFALFVPFAKDIWQRVHDPVAYVKKPIDGIHEKVRRDLLTAQAGHVPSRYKKEMLLALHGETLYSNPFEDLGDQSQRLAMVDPDPEVDVFHQKDGQKSGKGST